MTQVGICTYSKKSKHLLETCTNKSSQKADLQTFANI